MALHYQFVSAETRQLIDYSSSSDGQAQISFHDVSSESQAQNASIVNVNQVSSANVKLYSTPELLVATSAKKLAPLVDVTADGSVIRAGSQISLIVHPSGSCRSEALDLGKLSLYIDEIERRGRLLFVTSRDKLDDIPKADEKPARCDRAASRSSTASDVSDTSDDKNSDATSSAGSESLSAYESWSEASTDYEDEGVVNEVAPLYKATPGDKQETSLHSESDDSALNSDDSENDSDSDSADSIVEPVQLRYDMISDWSEGLDFIRADDNPWDDPSGFAEDQEADDAKALNDVYDDAIEVDDVQYVGEVDHDLMDESDDEEDEQVDSTDKKNKGEVANAANESSKKDSEAATSVIKPASKAQEARDSKDTKNGPPPSGSPLAQLKVYDLSRSPLAEQIFRFKRHTAEPQIHSSPPAVHPLEALVVWPMGDGLVLFADYLYKSYFLRRLRSSGALSKQISITPRFSRDGKFLYIAVIEQRTEPLSKLEKKKKTKAKKGSNKEDEKKEPRKYDLILNTYRLSQRKTTRAPPALVARTKLPLGCLNTVPPKYTWTNDELYIACASDELKILRLGLSSADKQGRNRVQVLNKPANISAKLEGRLVQEVYYFPPDDMSSNLATVVVRSEPVAFKVGDKEKAKSDEEGLIEDLKTSNTHDSTVSANVNDGLNSDTPLTKITVLHLGEQVDLGGWSTLRHEQLGMLQEGLGQMEIDLVPMDRTDDCDCE